MSDLVPGGNLALPEGALAIEVAGPFDLSALVTGEDGKVGGDGDFVFYNQPTAPGVRLRTGALAVDRQRLRPGGEPHHGRPQPGRSAHAPGSASRPRDDRHGAGRAAAGPFLAAAVLARDRAAARGGLPPRHGMEAAGPGAGVCGRAGGSGPRLRRGRGGGPGG
ncbi:hypothetical protein GCM10020000_70550 [Streptomyces olivoverticillatus]